MHDPETIRFRYWSKHPYGCRLDRGSPDSDQQTINFRHEERGACAGSGGDARDPPVRHPLRFQNVDKTGPATDVDAATLRIDEQVISVATGLGGGDELDARHGQNAKLGRGPKDHQNLTAHGIEGHREVRAVVRYRPFTGLSL